MKYIYGMRLRGFSLGTQPSKGLIEALDGENIDGHNYYNLLVYDRKLSEEETINYELDLIQIITGEHKGVLEWRTC